jgi:hypothetical protein
MTRPSAAKRYERDADTRRVQEEEYRYGTSPYANPAVAAWQAARAQ